MLVEKLGIERLSLSYKSSIVSPVCLYLFGSTRNSQIQREWNILVTGIYRINIYPLEKYLFLRKPDGFQ